MLIHQRSAHREKKVSEPRVAPRPTTPDLAASTGEQSRFIMSSGDAGAQLRTVYVGNLNYKTTGEDLACFFEGAEIGEVVNVDLKTRDDGRSRGWALVEFSSEEDAVSCVEQLNNAILQERCMTIRMDRKAGGAQDRGQRGGEAKANAGKFGQVRDSTRLFCGNLPWATDSTALYDMFQSFSPVKSDVIYGQDGRSRGYGIVEFSSVNDARAAIEGLNNLSYSGRNLIVRFDQGNGSGSSSSNRRAKVGGGGDGFGSRGSSWNTEATVFVGNLPWGVTWQNLKDLFASLSPEYADVKIGSDGRSKGWGTVRFASAEQAHEAIQRFNGYEVNGDNGSRAIEVRMDRGPSRR